MSVAAMQSNGSKTREIETSDTVLASWIVSQRIRPVRIEGTGSRKYFVFLLDAEVEELIQSFTAGVARVDPRLFAQSYKGLLHRLKQDSPTF